LNFNSANVNQNSLLKGNYAIISTEPSNITFKHLESVRRKISKQFKRIEKKSFKIILTNFYWRCYTKKPLLSRMGKGSGPINKWQTTIKQGSILLELYSHRNFLTVLNICKKSACYFPMQTTIIYKNINIPLRNDL